MSVLMAILCLSVPIGVLVYRARVDATWWALVRYIVVPFIFTPALAVALGVCLIWGIK